MKKTITIIVPIYNVEKFIEECLDSIVNQTSDNYKALLIDDGSTDASASKAQRYVDNYPNHFELHDKPNGGLSDARNFALNIVTSDYVMFLDSDDYISPQSVELLSNKLNERPLDIYCFGMEEVSEIGEHIRFIPPTSGSLSTTSLNENPQLITHALPNACNKLIKTELFRQHKILFPLGLWYEDLATIPKLYHVAENIGFIEDNLYQYRTRIGSITQSINPKILDMLAVLSSLENYYLENKHNANEALLSLTINMLMKTLVRIASCEDKISQQQMIKTVQDYINHKFSVTPYKILSIQSKFIYKIVIFATAIGLNKWVIIFLKYCIKKGLIR